MEIERFDPLDPDRLIGTVIRISGTQVDINLPHAADISPKRHFGTTIDGGLVGEFVVVETGHYALLGRINTVRLPERDRLSVEEHRLAEVREAHPVGQVSLMATVDLSTWQVRAGVARHPRLGSDVYAAHPNLVRWATSMRGDGEQGLCLASLIDDHKALVELSPDAMFGRHCAVVGTTGAGKSFTLMRLMLESLKFGYKVLLIDPMGEFKTLDDDRVTHLSLNRAEGKEKLVRLPFTRLTIEDLFAMFKPSGLVQGPKLREAIRSLRCCKLEAREDVVTLRKLNKNFEAVQAVYERHSAALGGGNCEFDVFKLTAQITHECVYPPGPDSANYGGEDKSAVSFCTPLVNRIEAVLGTPGMTCLFGDETHGADFVEEFDKFLNDENMRILRLSLEHLTYEHDAQPMVANAIARHALREARTRRFHECPLLLVVDEAHRYAARVADGDERFRLDSLELVAKEGRKDGLYLLLATQRPRDLGDGVLSQAGTLVCHRLTHPDDRRIVERVASEFDQNAAMLVASLTPGQAIVMGVDFPVPVTVKVTRPGVEPRSKSPSMAKCRKSAPSKVKSVKKDEPVPKTPGPDEKPEAVPEEPKPSSHEDRAPSPVGTDHPE